MIQLELLLFGLNTNIARNPFLSMLVFLSGQGSGSGWISPPQCIQRQRMARRFSPVGFLFSLRGPRWGGPRQGSAQGLQGSGLMSRGGRFCAAKELRMDPFFVDFVSWTFSSLSSPTLHALAAHAPHSPPRNSHVRGATKQQVPRLIRKNMRQCNRRVTFQTASSNLLEQRPPFSFPHCVMLRSWQICSSRSELRFDARLPNPPDLTSPDDQPRVPQRAPPRPWICPVGFGGERKAVGGLDRYLSNILLYPVHFADLIQR